MTSKRKTGGILLFFLQAILQSSSASDHPPSMLGLEPGEMRLCNDDLGVILWGPDSAPTLSIGKSDVWDRRNPNPPEPVLTLDRFKELAYAGDKSILNGAAYYSVYNSYDFPCPKPVGQLILRLNFLGDDGVLSVTPETSNIRFSAHRGRKGIDLNLFVSSVRNLIVLSGQAMNLEAGDLAFRLYRHRDTILPGGNLHPTIAGEKSPEDFEQLPMPSSGGVGQTFWIEQAFPSDPTFPEGFTSHLAATVDGASWTLETFEGADTLGTPLIAETEGRISHAITKRYTPINESPGSAADAVLARVDGPLTLIATVATTQDATDPTRLAQEQLQEALGLGVEALWSEHKNQLDEYSERPHAVARTGDGNTVVDSAWGGVPYKVRPWGYYGDVPLCSVASTKYCFQDSSPWHGDFHFNELDATSYCILRQFDVLDSYFSMVLNLLPMAQANARQVYDCPGAMYPLVHYPLKADTVVHTHFTWEQSMEITALILKPLWQRFLYTWDTDFLQETAYPAMREGARFYADFLERGEDGLYSVFPTVSPEHRGITKNLEYNRNSQSGITLIRYHLRATAQAAKILGIDPDESAKWREIAENMPGYPTVETDEGPLYIDVEGAHPIEYNIPVPLSAVFWGDDIGLDSSAEQMELAKRTLRLINVWEPHRGYLNRVRTRLGIVPEDGRLGVENFLQSHTGVIHLFPAVPDNFTGEFENFGAQGGFIVAASKTLEGIQSVTVKSLAGNPCTLVNPWPGKGVEIAQPDGPSRNQDDEQGKLIFDTKIGGTYQLREASSHSDPH